MEARRSRAGVLWARQRRSAPELIRSPLSSATLATDYADSSTDWCAARKTRTRTPMGFVVRLQDRPSLLKVSLESGLVQGAAYWLPQCSVWCAPAAGLWLYRTAVRRAADRAKVRQQRRNIEGLDFSSSGSAMRHICPRGTQNSPRTPAYAHRGASEGIQTKWWSNDAIFARGASRRETRAPHRPTSHGPLLHHFVSDRRRPHNKRYPTLRWPDRLETAPKKTIAAHFAWFLAVFSA